MFKLQQQLNRRLFLINYNLQIASHYQQQRKFISSDTKDHNVSPLENVRVLDLTRIVAGPYCTMILSDLGAEVIKIERPGSGDEARKWGPPFINNTQETCYFIALNRNKKSMCLDLKTQDGQQILKDLAKQSDILIENYVPGKLKQYNLDYDNLKLIAPQLIYCSISGYGSYGPYAQKPGYDVIAASIGGLLHITGPEDGEPVKVGVAVTDLATGLYAHGAIMAALLKRYKTGCGQKIDCNLLSTQLASLINIGSNYLNCGKEAKRWGTAHESIVPYQTFQTLDGYLTIGTGSDLQFKELCELLNRHDLHNDSRFKTNQLRVENRKELIAILKEIIKTKTNQEWSVIFKNTTFPNGPVNTMKETFNDPHIKEIDLIKTIQHPVAGDVRVVGPPVVYSDGGNHVRSPPPTLGQHTDDILKNLLNFNDQQLNDLRNKKIIQ